MQINLCIAYFLCIEAVIGESVLTGLQEQIQIPENQMSSRNLLNEMWKGSYQWPCNVHNPAKL